mgnify:CR=1 FL=1
MGNISYSVTDVCYNFYRSSSPFNATSAYYTGNEKEQSFIAFIKQEITSHEMKVSTRKNHESTINLLRRFRPKVCFKDINYQFVCDFEMYMESLAYNKNTIAKHMKHLKRHINAAINKDLINLKQYPFRQYKIKTQTPNRNHLTPDELQKIENYPSRSCFGISRCRDMFLFSCYTGLRFSDITRLQKDNFQLIDGKWWLIFKSLKTGVNIKLPIYMLFDGKPIEIFKKYNQRNFNESLFGLSTSSNSAINKQLRKLARKVKLYKHISFHTARHTCATILLYNGVQLTTVQKLLGHQSIRTTEVYSDIMDMTIVRDLAGVKKRKKERQQNEDN